MNNKNKKHSSIIYKLDEWVRIKPDEVAYHYLVDNTDKVTTLTYKELQQKAHSIAVELKSNLKKGDRVILLYPQGIEYICAFWACLYAGVIGVPAFPPRSKRQAPRIYGIIKDTKPRYLLTTTKQHEVLKGMVTPENDGFEWLNTDLIDNNNYQNWRPIQIEKNDLAFLQYTSGSTGDPKGVMISHGNLLCNEEMIQNAMETTSKDVIISWLPIFHDMGLIGGMLHPIFLGAKCVIMSPSHFLQKPIRWLEAVTEYKGTIMVSPNFALDLCVKSITSEEKVKLDLSTVEVFCNGSEPIRNETLESFYQAFKDCGFKSESLFPTYGMAETTLMVTGSGRSKLFVANNFCKEALKTGIARSDLDDQENTTRLVSSGQSVCKKQKVIIVNPENLEPLGQGKIGEILISGEHVALGYWDQINYTQEIFRNKVIGYSEDFLRTGDLGFISDSEIFVTGRIKDAIIINGRNYYPQDIEQVVEYSHIDFRKTGTAVFSKDNDGKEEVVVCQELERRACKKANLVEMKQIIRDAVWAECDLIVNDVVILKPAGVPKTSSGKVQRQKCKQDYLSGQQKVVNQTKKKVVKEVVNEKNHDDEKPVLEQSVSKIKLKHWLVNEIAKMCDLSIATIDPSQAFSVYGMGSIEAVRLSGLLSDKVGDVISPTIAYDYPTINTLVDHIFNDLYEETINHTNHTQEPIAVISAECRFPGAEDIDAFWELLINGKDGVSVVPKSRWDIDEFYSSDNSQGKMNSKYGGFISDVELFDNEFFDISIEEAKSLDPQQRILLETAWKTLERGNQTSEHLSGSDSGVFIGISNNDYGRNTLSNINELNGYINSGNAFSIAANRISYFMNWKGPSQAIDTACSSSLVAIHQACQSLRNNECSLALAGGVNLILRPELTIAFSQAQMMAPDGKCKVFDAAADGYVRSEGCGLVLLKRLEDAKKDGDHILGVIKSSSINQDGRSNGLTAPNSQAQKSVIQNAISLAGLSEQDISYIECHGTGTPLGDPIEVNALQGIFKNSQCTIGSVKSNIGHLESAAGVAGFIKTLLCLRHHKIPQQVNFNNLNPAIDLADNLSIAIEEETWTANEKFAGVSAFSFGGSNAHVILAEAPLPSSYEHNALEKSQNILCLSCNDINSLQNKSQAYAYCLEKSKSLTEFCTNSFYARSHLQHRLAIVADNKESLYDSLIDFSKGALTNNCYSGIKTGTQKLAFLFADECSEFKGLDQTLYFKETTFKKELDYCAELLRDSHRIDLLTLLFASDQTISTDTKSIQIAHFSLGYCLYKFWQSKNIFPDAVIGHGLGEYVAACVANMFSFEDAIKIVLARAELLSENNNGEYALESQLAFKKSLSEVLFLSPQLPFVSSQSGLLIDEPLNSEYWLKGVGIKNTDVFMKGAHYLLKIGVRHFLEVGQQHMLIPIVADVNQQHENHTINKYFSLAKDTTDYLQIHKTAAKLYCAGFNLHKSFFAGELNHKASLPLTQFNKKKFWIDADYKKHDKVTAKTYSFDWTEIKKHKNNDYVDYHWLILSDGSQWQTEVCLELNNSSQKYTLFSSHEKIDRLNQEITDEKPLMILYLWALEKRNDPQLLEYCAGYKLTQLWKYLKPSGLACHFWGITSDTFFLDQNHELKNISLSSIPYQGLWSYWRGMMQEFPLMSGGMIDLDTHMDFKPSQVLDEILNAGYERQIILRNDKRYSFKWKLVDSDVHTDKKLEGTYFIAGAFGGIGQSLVNLLFDKGVRNFVFLSRSQLPKRKEWESIKQLKIKNNIAFVKHMQTRGARIQVVQGDVKNKQRIAKIFAAIDKSSYPPIKGIIYSAGVRVAEKADEISKHGFDEVVNSKFLGAMNIHELSLSYELDMFVMCSSAGASLGAPGQVSYGAANASLDALAAMRKAMKLPALSINWGPWSDQGMYKQAQQHGEKSMLSEAGIEACSSDDNIAQLSGIIDGDYSQVMIAMIDWNKYLSLYEKSPIQSVFESFVDKENKQVKETKFISELRKLSIIEREQVVIESLIQELSQVLKNSSVIQQDMPFDALGMDSITAIEFKNRLQKKLQINIPATITYNYPNLNLLSQHILNDLLQLGKKDEGLILVESDKHKQRDDSSNERFAIIGMSCRFAGGADTPEKYWQMLIDGKDVVSEIPKNRWDIDQYYSAEPGAAGKTYSRYGAFINDVDMFAADFFEISHREAKSMDPQHRLLLEVCWQAFENAGIPVDSLVNKTCGIYVGIGQNDYARKSNIESIDTYDGTGNGFCFAAGRIAHVFGLRGPTMSVDTACSSSLMALHLACQSLKSQESEIAIATGVQLMLSPESGVFLSKSGALTAGKHARIFDNKADGFLRGEGCGAVIVKRLSDAQRDGDNILAQICSTATNHDGRSRGLTVPNGSAQKELIETALHNSGVDPHSVDLVEAHGTGTVLGDPVEVGALVDVYAAKKRQSALEIRSVKANIGHLEAAAGIAGVIKTVLSLQNKKIPGQLHFSEGNAHIDWHSGDISVVNKNKSWPEKKQKRRAAVSAFGLSGSNVHVILEEVETSVDKAAIEQKQPLCILKENHAEQLPLVVFLITARNKNDLLRLAESYFQRARVSDTDLPTFCLQVNTSRKLFNHRLSIPAINANDLYEKIGKFVNQNNNEYYGISQEQPTLVADLLLEIIPELEKINNTCTTISIDISAVREKITNDENTLNNSIAHLCINNTITCWDKYLINNGRYYSLPNYPFNRKQFWIKNPPELEKVNVQGSGALSKALRSDDYQSILADIYKESDFQVSDKEALVNLLKVLKKYDGLPDSTSQIKPYIVDWEEKEGIKSTSIDANKINNNWIIYAEQSDAATALINLLKARGDEIYLISSKVNPIIDNHVYWYDDHNDIDIGGFLNGQRSSKIIDSKFIFLADFDFDYNHDDQLEKCAGYTLSSLLAQLSRYVSITELYLITSGAVEIGGGCQSIQQVLQAPLMACARSLSLELPSMKTYALDLNPKEVSAEIQMQAAVDYFSYQSDNNQVAFRDNKIYVPRLKAIEKPENKRPNFNEEDSYLISGGLGGLAFEMAKYLIKKGVRHFILTSRRQLSDINQAGLEKIQSLRELGAKVELLQVDFSNKIDTIKVIKQAHVKRPIKGIVHAAGCINRVEFTAIKRDEFLDMVSAKIIATLVLHEASLDMQLDFFINFSSISATIGTKQLGHYAASNAFLDAFSYYRQSLGLAAQTINWGPWSDTGMLTAQQKYSNDVDLSESGIIPRLSGEYLDAFFRVMSRSSNNIVLADINWKTFLPLVSLSSMYPFFEAFIEEDEHLQADVPSQITIDLQACTPKLRQIVLSDFIQKEVAKVLQMEPDLPAKNMGFTELGIDSLMALEIKTRMTRALNTQLSATLIFNYPTINQLSEYLLDQVMKLDRNIINENQEILDIDHSYKIKDQDVNVEKISGENLVINPIFDPLTEVITTLNDEELMSEEELISQIAEKYKKYGETRS